MVNKIKRLEVEWEDCAFKITSAHSLGELSGVCIICREKIGGFCHGLIEVRSGIIEEIIQKRLEDERFLSFCNPKESAVVRYAVVPEEFQFGIQNFLIYQYRPRIGDVAIGEMIMPTPLPFRTHSLRDSSIKPHQIIK